MFNEYTPPPEPQLQFCDLTVEIKNKIVDEYAVGGTPTSIMFKAGVPTYVAVQAIAKMKSVESFCVSTLTCQGHEEGIECDCVFPTSVTGLKNATKAHFTGCSVMALDYLVTQIVAYSNGVGTADFTHWKNGVLGNV